MGLNGFSGIRGSSAAAPLKDMQLWWMTRRSPRYPRLISRGPIEGSRYFACLPEPLLYPRLISRGPIDGHGMTAVTLTGGVYPRLRCRGPIEGRFSSFMCAAQLGVSAAHQPRPH